MRGRWGFISWWGDGGGGGKQKPDVFYLFTGRWNYN